MRTLLAMALLIVLLVALGVMHFSKSDDKVHITIDTGKLEQKADQAVEAGKQALEDAEEFVEDAAEDVSDRTEAEPSVRKPEEDSAYDKTSQTAGGSTTG